MMHPTCRRHGGRRSRHIRICGALWALLSQLAATPVSSADPAIRHDAGVAGPADPSAASTNPSAALEANVPADVGTIDTSQNGPTPLGRGHDLSSASAKPPDRESSALREGPRSVRTSGVEFTKHRVPGRVAWSRTGLGALALVLVLIGGLAWALRRWVPAARRVEGGVLRVAGRASLTPKHSVALLQVGQRFVVVGVGGDAISALCEIENPEEVAYLARRTGASGHARRERDAAFEAFLSREAANYEAEAIDSPSGAGRNQFDRPHGGGGLRELLGKLRAVHHAGAACPKTES